jgi:hypothetical protein
MKVFNIAKEALHFLASLIPLSFIGKRALRFRLCGMRGDIHADCPIDGEVLGHVTVIALRVFPELSLGAVALPESEAVVPGIPAAKRP